MQKFQERKYANLLDLSIYSFRIYDKKAHPEVVKLERPNRVVLRATRIEPRFQHLEQIADERCVLLAATHSVQPRRDRVRAMGAQIDCFSRLSRHYPEDSGF